MFENYCSSLATIHKCEKRRIRSSCTPVSKLLAVFRWNCLATVPLIFWRDPKSNGHLMALVEREGIAWCTPSTSSMNFFFLKIPGSKTETIQFENSKQKSNLNENNYWLKKFRILQVNVILQNWLFLRKLYYLVFYWYSDHNNFETFHELRRCQQVV